MLIEFTRQLNKIEKEMWELEEKGKTTDPEYYRLTGARTVATQLQEFYEKQMVATGRIVPEGEQNAKYPVSPD